MEQINEATAQHHTADTQYVTVNGTRFAYRRWGNPESIPLLFLQHFTGTMDNWDPTVTNGLAAYGQVILFDNKGMGASEGATPSTIEVMAQDAVAFIKAVGLEKVNLLGYSMGGFIAQQMVLQEPDLISKIILAGTGPEGGEGISGIMKPLTVSATMTPDEQKLYLFYESTATSRELGKQSLKRINKRIAERDREASVETVQAQLTAILNWASPKVSVLPNLQQINHPVWVVNGSNDIIVPTINSYALFQQLPNARLSLYPDSGHGAIFQYPALFVREAIAFLTPPTP